MVNLVTKNFIRCHNALKDNGIIRSSRQFAISLDSHAQTISEILNEKRNVSLEILRKIVDVYPVQPTFLLTGDGDIFINNATSSSNQELKNLSNILYVPAKAHAGYLDNIAEGLTNEDCTSFTLPEFKNMTGNFRCFEAYGDSMEPSIYSGEKLVASLVDSNNYYSSIRDNFVYIIVCKNEILVKRIKNKIKENQTLLLQSDNNFYPGIEMPIYEVLELWRVDTKITPFMHSPGNVRGNFDQDIDDLREVISLQNTDLKQLNSTIEKLLKSSRNPRY
jgi:plasmid maintenance system antidote protein VapI